MVGGYGTRLRPLTNKIPKCLIPLANKPIIEYITEKIIESGLIDEIFLIGREDDLLVENYIHQNSESIKSCRKHESIFKSTYEFIKEMNQTVLIWWGDVIASIDVKAMIESHVGSNSLATMALFDSILSEESRILGIARIYQQKVIQYIDFPSQEELTSNLILSGVFLFEPEIVRILDKYQQLPNCDWSVKGVLEYLVNHQVFNSYIFQGYRINNNSLEDVLRSNMQILKQENNSKNMIGNSCEIEASAQIGDFVSIGNRVRIQQGVFIGNSILFDDSMIEANAVIENSIIYKGVIIRKDEKVKKRIVI